MRSRTSAAYRGLYVLLQQQGAKDFVWKARLTDIEGNEKAIDVHHIFPRKWCDDRNIPSTRYDSIVNKTAISAKANRSIGGRAPSAYLKLIQSDPTVQLSDSEMDSILATHCINPTLLRADDFEKFYADRRARLLSRVEEAMGKKAEPPSENATEELFDVEDED